jgi:hypothetical protein
MTTSTKQSTEVGRKTPSRRRRPHGARNRSQRRSRSGSGSGGSDTNKAPPRTAACGGCWWLRVDAECPISLEPLSKLTYPPFGLHNSAPRPHTGLVGGPMTYFDGRVLAHYLVSTGTFTHPISRRALTQQECEALDKYMTQHRLGCGRVLEAFKRRAEYQPDAEGNPGTLGMQAEAEALLQGLFVRSGFRAAAAETQARRRQRSVGAGADVATGQGIVRRAPSQHSSPAPQPGTGTAQAPATSAVGLSIVDCEAAEATAAMEQNHTSMARQQSFPSLPAQASPAPVVCRGTWAGSTKLVAPATLHDTSEFPGLAGTAAPATTSGSGAQLQLRLRRPGGQGPPAPRRWVPAQHKAGAGARSGPALTFEDAMRRSRRGLSSGARHFV